MEKKKRSWEGFAEGLCSSGERADSARVRISGSTDRREVAQHSVLCGRMGQAATSGVCGGSHRQQGPRKEKNQSL